MIDLNFTERKCIPDICASVKLSAQFCNSFQKGPYRCSYDIDNCLCFFFEFKLGL
jgi:hypothetical protein